MGFFSDVVDSFTGGAERDAGRRAARGQREAGALYEGLYPRAESRMQPFQRAGQNALGAYTQNIGRQAPGSALPSFNYSGAPGQFNYQSNIPGFNYDGQQPGYSRDSAVPSFSYQNNIPQWGGSEQFQFDPSKMAENPAYQFRMDQGMQALNRGAGKSGNLNSGNRLLELMNYGQGLASTEYDNEWNRQMASSQENYGRGLTDYNLSAQREQELYGRATDNYGREYQREGDEYARGLTSYDIARQREGEQYGRSLTGYEIGRQNEADQYGRALTGYNMGRENEATMYNRATEQYGMGTDRANTMYGRNQNYLNQLAGLADMGFNTHSLLNNIDLNSTSGQANARIGAANALAAGTIGGANALRGTAEMGMTALGWGGFGG